MPLIETIEYSLRVNLKQSVRNRSRLRRAQRRLDGAEKVRQVWSNHR
jgi:hypothetical protein